MRILEIEGSRHSLDKNLFWFVHLYNKIERFFSFYDKHLSYKMSTSFKIFIPFIHEEYSEKMVRTALREHGLCNVVRIDMHEKKEKNKNGSLSSLNHSYAFVVVQPLDSFQGKRFLENVKQQKNTHIIHDNDSSKYWTLKPYLSMEERMDKGFSLLRITVPESDSEEEEAECDEEKEEETDCDEAVPEWLHEPDSKFALSDIPPLPKWLHEPESKIALGDIPALPECLRFMTEETVREAYEISVQRKSYFASLEAKQEIADDYDDIERDLIRVHRLMQVILV
jgi:hypothetical protein